MAVFQPAMMVRRSPRDGGQIPFSIANQGTLRLTTANQTEGRFFRLGVFARISEQPSD
jgi:hypothetical protein